MTTTVTAQRFKKYRIPLKLLRASPFVWFFAFLFFEVFTLSSLVGQHKQATVDEFNQLPQMPGAHLLEYSDYVKEEYINVYGLYATTKSLTETLAYFKTQFSQMGWQFERDNYIKFEGMGMVYCKGDYTASVDYYEIGRAWKYQLSLDWGYSSDCQTMRGGARTLIALVPLLFLLGGSLSWATYAFIIWRATRILDKKEFESAMSAIVNKPSFEQAREVSLGIFFLSILGFLLSIYGILSLNW
jgi:hypothetical protein